MAPRHSVAIVTGSGRGIGAAVAKRLAKDGYAVAINYSNDEAAAAARNPDRRHNGWKFALRSSSALRVTSASM